MVDFEKQLKALVPHDHIAYQQSQYLKELKTSLPENDIIAICDFSENYAFKIQDSIQAAYYDTAQCTIHPICIYYKEGKVVMQKSIIVIAESKEHNVQSFYLFQRKMIEYLKDFFGDQYAQKSFKFFSDGAASQYKNKYNFLNLCLFKKDFGINAEWHFFATSHGKSPCDALGGAFKRNARNHNMKYVNDQKLNAKELFEWAKTSEKIHFIFCSEEEHQLNAQEFKNDAKTGRFDQDVKTVKGTQGFHFFKPKNDTQIEASFLSTSKEKTTFTLIK